MDAWVDVTITLDEDAEPASMTGRQREVQKVRSISEILVRQKPPQGVFVCDHAGLGINEFFKYLSCLLVGLGAFPLQNCRTCTASPACQVKKRLTRTRSLSR